MRTIILFLLLAVIPFSLSAQNKATSKTIRPAQCKGFKEYNSALSPKNADSIKNKPFNPFKLTTPDGNVLKSDEMKGKVVVMDFWATWCAPCRKLTKELDSLFTKYYERSDFQMIGVNFNEDLVKKGNDPIKYWKEHGYTFPMTLNNNKYGKSVDAGNPTVFVIDQKGIFRGRWDAWTPNTAEEISYLIWALLENPEIGIDDVYAAVNNKEYYKALHLCDQFIKEYPDEIKTFAPVKFNLMKQSSKEEAFVFIKQVVDTIADYKSLGKMLLDSKTIDVSTLSREELFECLLKEMKQEKNSSIYESLAYGYYKTGKRIQAIKAMEKAIQIAKEKNSPSQMLDWMYKALKEFKKEN